MPLMTGRDRLIMWLGMAFVMLVGCAGIEVDTTPTERFAALGYTTYSWRTAAIVVDGGETDALSLIDPNLRAAVDHELRTKGYVLTASDGEFLVDYQFRASLSEGALNSTAREASNPYPHVDPNVVINRQPNQALIDNAFALGGPKAVNSIVIHFTDHKNQRALWAASISKMVENINEPDPNKMATGIKRGVARAFRALPQVSQD